MFQFSFQIESFGGTASGSKGTVGKGCIRGSPSKTKAFQALHSLDTIDNELAELIWERHAFKGLFNPGKR